MGFPIAQYYAKMSLDTKDFKRGLAQTKSGLGGLDRAFGGLAGGIAGLGALAGVGFATSFVADLVTVGAEAQRLEMGFNTLSQSMQVDAQSMMSAMREASDGMISDTDLMLAANRAMLLGVSESADQMAQLMEVAKARGAAMGLSTSQAFNDLVTGIGRASPLILDNLGIVTGGEKVYDDYAAAIGKTKDQLTEIEKKQALANLAISSSQGLIQAQTQNLEMAKNTMEQATAAIDNFKVSIGLAMAEGENFALIMGPLIERLNGMSDAIKRGNTDLQDGGLQMYAKNIVDLAARQDELNQRMQEGGLWAKFQGNMMMALVDSSMSVSQEISGLSVEQARLLSTTSQGVDRFDDYGDAAAEAATDLALLEKQAAASAQAVADINAQLKATGGLNVGVETFRQASQLGSMVVPKVGAAGGVKYMEDMASQISKQRSLWNLAGYEVSVIDSVLMPSYIQQLTKATEDQYGLNQQVAKMPQAWKDAESAFNDMLSKVEGALSEALSLDAIGGESLFSDILPREDAVQEDAFRLADVMVKGFESPWAEYFKSNFPQLFDELTAGGDIKAGAAKMLREFQAGLRPELLDMDQLKQGIKDQLTRQTQMDAIAKQLATELSQEMGINMEQVLAASRGFVGGTTGTDLGGEGGAAPLPVVPELQIDPGSLETQLLDVGTPVGSTFGTIFHDGTIAEIEGKNTGGQIVSKVVEQISAGAATITMSGKGSGQLWGQGFLDVVGQNVPPGLVKILTDLVTPGVQANLQSEQSRTGAQ